MAMRFEHEFTVPVPIEQAWSVLLDVERVAPCLPGAALDAVDGDSFTGRMKLKVGPITVTYRGEAAFEDVDKDLHSLTIKASGKEMRGSGTAAATVTARLRPEVTSTRVTVETSFTVTGRPAQFGRGVMAEVGGRLVDRFAANLAELLREGSSPEPPAESAVAPEPVAAGSVISPDGVEQEGPGIRHLTAVPSPPETAPAATTAMGIATSAAATVAAAEQARAQKAHPAGVLRRPSRISDEEALDLLEVAGVPLLKRAAPLLIVLAGFVLADWLIRRALRRR
ncbi:SRPBCC family protein [Streptosporangium sp. NPDC000396]|uniref:SRPBCC family protein n=1 Tax=Streptosporangium sp. NPDC000396 TaxID=3366185 RepID=UPI0036A4FB96